MSTFDLAPGTVFGDDFKVLSPLSRGGMGAVYVVEQVSTQKRRALKLMLAARAADPEMRKRFEQEAKVGAMIPSEHVVDVIAAGIDARTQIPWLAMELLDGEDLESFAERRGTLTPAEVYEIFSQLCHALAAAHAIPIVHRDLKPGNIFLARPRMAEARSVVKVLDFGIAKIVGAAPSTTAALGTPLWMAPEQSEPRAPINPAADVWALGLIAFRLLTGRLYWVTANDPDKPALSVVREVLFEPLVSATERARVLGADSKLPAGFDAWFDRTVTRDLAKRFPDAGAAWSALKDVLVPGRAAQTSGSGLDLNVSSTPAVRRHAEGLASTLMATPPAISPNAATATLDAVGQTLGQSKGATMPARSSSRTVAVLVALIAVLAIGAGAFVLLREAPRAPIAAASSSASAPASVASVALAVSSTPVASASAATSPSAAPSASAVASAPRPTSAPATPHTTTPRASVTAKPPEPTAAPPPPRPTASAPFLL